MNGRTCQLCGKPLSRFTVGSGGDFCSREHRNQFRLRLGMDRLQEANKVASLMRRRENAKAIPASQLTRDFKVLPRMAPPMPTPVRHAAMHSMQPLTAALETVRIASTPRSLIDTSPQATAVRSVARAIQSAETFTGRQVRQLLPYRAERLSAQLRPAGAVLPHQRLAELAERRRQMSEIQLSLIRTHFGSGGIQISSLRSSSRNCQEPQRARPLANSADRGRELRVSGGIGFRLPSARVRSVTFTAPRTTPLRHATEARNMAASSLPADDRARSAALRIFPRGPLGPKPPEQNNAIEFRWPNAVVTSAGRARQTAEAIRTCGVEWKANNPCPPQVRVNGVVHFRPAAVLTPFVSTPVPHAMDSTHRMTTVAFEPEEKPFEWSPTALHGTLVSGLHFGATPVRKTDTPSVTLEEHFDAGLQNWLGGTHDWKVDVAGVRAGSLALYTPSLETADYLLEFLTRFESRGVSWVFRAANFNDYHHATFAMAPDGAYELRRHAVIGGVAEPPTVCPMPPDFVAPAARTAVTLRTRVEGDEFTISLDGQVIETWTDSRLTTGGIGFLGVPEDRARLYWVKVTPTGHVNKEYSK